MNGVIIGAVGGLYQSRVLAEKYKLLVEVNQDTVSLGVLMLIAFGFLAPPLLMCFQVIFLNHRNVEYWEEKSPYIDPHSLLIAATSLTGLVGLYSIQLSSTAIGFDTYAFCLSAAIGFSIAVYLEGKIPREIENDT